ncbi:MAG: HlyD family efflux transporter periplasmic adaptor subunit [Leadbetterella sp.]|nr:HlyD family efflux transporter periplasmic adaptor subunit [Leadbetterella sp.]
MKFRLLLPVFIPALILGLTACSGEPETRPVVQDIKELVFASGQVEWRDAYSLVAQTDGILGDLVLEVGDEVQAGQLLGSIQNPANTENLKTAGRQVELAKENAGPLEQQIRQNIGFAEQKYRQDKLQRERYERLYVKQSVSRQEFENMKLAEENALAQLNALKEQLDAVKVQNEQALTTARNQQANSRILNAYNELRGAEKGKVIRKQKFRGDFVRRGDVIATIADEARTEVVLNVDESSIAKVKTGQAVFIRLNTEKEKTYSATVTEILAAFDEAIAVVSLQAGLMSPG